MPDLHFCFDGVSVIGNLDTCEPGQLSLFQLSAHLYSRSKDCFSIHTQTHHSSPRLQKLQQFIVDFHAPVYLASLGIFNILEARGKGVTIVLQGDTQTQLQSFFKLLPLATPSLSTPKEALEVLSEVKLSHIRDLFSE